MKGPLRAAAESRISRTCPAAYARLFPLLPPVFFLPGGARIPVGGARSPVGGGCVDDSNAMLCGLGTADTLCFLEQEGRTILLPSSLQAGARWRYGLVMISVKIFVLTNI